MKRTYLCPHCDAILNPSTKIILRASARGNSGLFLFSPKPGNYEVVIPHRFTLQPQDPVEFSCPVCGHDLTSSKGATWAEIAFETSSAHEGRVVFSKVYGHHATLIITREEVRLFGEDAPESTNFFGEGHLGQR